MKVLQRSMIAGRLYTVRTSAYERTIRTNIGRKPQRHRQSEKPSETPAPPNGVDQSYAPSTLAFLGDSLWTVHVRAHYLLPRKHIKTYRALADKEVTAEAQAEYCRQLKASGPASTENRHFVLTQLELEILQWAAAEKPQAARQRFRSDADRMQQYQLATALEALIGYLHLTNPSRCIELLTYMTNKMGQSSSS